MAPSSQPLRVGSVPYLVARPLDAGLEARPDVEYTQAVPARLVEGLRAGRLDVALVSSIELFRCPGYRYLADLAVAGRGFVSSVQIFLSCPLAEVRRLVLDPASRAAAALSRVVMAERHPGPPPEWVEIPPGQDPAEAGGDAWLRIGDAALREYLGPGGRETLNPSEVWASMTGLPFAFAVWMVRPGVELSPRQLEAFAEARRAGSTRWEALAEEASRRWSLPLAACRRYFGEECLYEPGPQLADALTAFRDRAAALDLCRSDLSPPALPTFEARVG